MSDGETSPPRDLDVSYLHPFFNKRLVEWDLAAEKKLKQQANEETPDIIAEVSPHTTDDGSPMYVVKSRGQVYHIPKFYLPKGMIIG